MDEILETAIDVLAIFFAAMVIIWFVDYLVKKGFDNYTKKKEVKKLNI